MIDIKAKQQVRSLAEPKKQQSVLSFLQELKEELKRVSWTTKAELVFFTKIVIGATFLLGIGIYGIDLIIKGCLDAVAVLVRLIFG